jgi:hypothetical protein
MLEVLCIQRHRAEKTSYVADWVLPLQCVQQSWKLAT